MNEPVEPYLHKALAEMGKMPRLNFFSPSNNLPQFTRGKVNRILMYPGAFNPPHLGHLGFLRHVLDYQGDDLLIVAAMIHPKDDEFVADKNEDADETFAISHNDRCDLWEKDTQFPENAFIWRDSEVEMIKFGKKLIEIAGREGIEIRFVLLFGAEKLDTTLRPSNWRGLCPEAITSDIGRRNELFPPSEPSEILGYSKWRVISREVKGNDSLPKNSIFIPLPGHSSVVHLVWGCESVGNPHHKIYLVTYIGDVRSRMRGEDVSSTQIRRALREERGTILALAMSETALSPRLLLEKIISGAVWMDVDQQESIKSSLKSLGLEETE